ncbi:MAG: hypothetical protein P4N24_14980 [Acidobacteriota bacterium]|nr:hypothetical protein [Acidobacteriota bacterium]
MVRGRKITVTMASSAPPWLAEFWGDLYTHSSRYGLRPFARYTGSLPMCLF